MSRCPHDEVILEASSWSRLVCLLDTILLLHFGIFLKFHFFAVVFCQILAARSDVCRDASDTGSRGMVEIIGGLGSSAARFEKEQPEQQAHVAEASSAVWLQRLSSSSSSY